MENPTASASVNTQVVERTEQLPLASRWKKGQLIGRGTFGSVYIASNQETRALCALKEYELLPDDPNSAECIMQLKQEIEVLSQLRHPNILQYYGSEIVDNRLNICLEYAHHGSIDMYIQEHLGALTESIVCNFTRHIVTGLACLHVNNSIHGDLKGANLFVDASGIVKLADFGIAKHLTRQAAYRSLKASLNWIAPELVRSLMVNDNSTDHDHTVDMWSLGCPIIQSMNGISPWSEYAQAAAIFKVMQSAPPIPETLSAEGKDFLQCCFRRQPAERPPAAMLLEHAFRQI
ncbi:mitogen-activated protein kinase kinase kinase 5-like isoform X2 [Syzygium oleosum]|uniref:mitogen-activated protein kinase kinase kinase 5-like isoform X2 n=1 Tax=Syzygium oleosum TaxID=219896 RepID=UPI0024B9D06C|nr:mitogen-activated protein kinase kinase kinase 5-like isoform X2 [Syzygium oleosum]